MVQLVRSVRPLSFQEEAHHLLQEGLPGAEVLWGETLFILICVEFCGNTILVSHIPGLATEDIDWCIVCDISISIYAVYCGNVVILNEKIHFKIQLLPWKSTFKTFHRCCQGDFDSWDISVSLITWKFSLYPDMKASLAFHFQCKSVAPAWSQYVSFRLKTETAAY